jgi:hypothetical protein
MNAFALEQKARTQFVFREVNERIAELSPPLLGDEAKLFVCECSSDDCAEALELTLDQYHALRARPARFVVLDGHELDEIETVVQRYPACVVVEKRGEAGALAAASDPRQR